MISEPLAVITVSDYNLIPIFIHTLLCLILLVLYPNVVQLIHLTFLTHYWLLNLHYIICWQAQVYIITML